MPTTQANNKKIAKNTLYLYIRMFFVLIINLYISRVLLNTLGVSDYGTYVVVAGFVTLFGFFNATLSSTMQRYYNYAGTKAHAEGLQEVFATGFIIHIIIAAITFVLLESFGVWYFYNFLVIPASRFNAALIVFHASVISLILLMLQMPFTGLILSQERMGYYSFVSIIDIILKLAVTLSLNHLPFDSLASYGILLMCISVIDLLLYSIYSKVNWKFIHLSKHISKALTKSLLSFTGWNLLGTFAFMLRGQGVSLLLNSFFGPVVNAARGIAMQVSNAIQNFSANISIAFSPQLVNSVAAEDNQRAESLMFAESKICYALLLIIATPLCLEINYVLNIWLGEKVPYQTNIFSVLMLVDALICTLNTPCTQAAMATGNIKIYQIGGCIVNLCLIPTCYIFLKLGFSAVSSFIITIIFSILLQTVCFLCLHKIFKFSINKYLRTVLAPCLCITIIIPLLPSIAKYNLQSSFVRLLTVCIIDVLIAVPTIYFILLNRKERSYALAMLQKYTSKFSRN